MYGPIETPESPRCAQRGLCQGLEPIGDSTRGFFYPTPSVMGDGWTHAIHLPGIGSEVEVKSSSFFNYQAAFYGCAWCSAHRGGYEMGFENVSLVNVEHVAHFKHGVGGIIVDRDGSLTGFAGGTVVPPTGQVMERGEFFFSMLSVLLITSLPTLRLNVLTHQRTPHLTLSLS